MSPEREDNIEDQAVATDEPPQYGVGPFTIRELSLVGVWVIAFVVSFFPVVGPIGVGPSVWSSGIDWVLTIGLPTVAVFLIVLRRLSPQGIRRVGSLGIDQFASVAFSVAAVVWLTTIWTSFITLANQRVFAATWVVWVEFVMMLVGIVLTVLAPFIPPFDQDFRGRPEVPAHRNARPVRPVVQRPAKPRPAPPAGQPADVPGDVPADRGGYGEFAPAVAPQAAGSYGPDATQPIDPAEATEPRRGEQPVEAAEPTREQAVDQTPTAVWEPTHTRQSYEPIDQGAVAAEPTAIATAEPGSGNAAPEAETAEPDPAAARPARGESTGAAEPAAAYAVAGPDAHATPPRHQAFWALVPEERDVVDEIGIPVFRIGPTAWALVIEDRGDVFVVRHEDGRIGYLHDVSGVTRG